MKQLSSRKLAGAVAAMLAVVALVLVPSYAEVVVDLPVQLAAIASVTGLGGFQILRQAVTDDHNLGF